MELDKKLLNFRNEIDSGLNEIYKNYSYIDGKVSKPEYGFLYWVLMNLYNVDEELVKDYITEYNDKSIDCFVHFEENKELYIIQCKYYEINGVVIRNDVSDFLQMPMTALLSGNYKKSKKLQKIFSDAIEDPEYKIFFHFYSTSTYYSEDIEASFKRFNYENHNHKALLKAEFVDLKGIYEKYYGKSYKEKKNLTFSLGTVNRGTFASLREEYGIQGLRCEAYYIITPVSEIYRLRATAKNDGYQLFEENIREYLGESAVNKGIIDTLRGNEKSNFLFYNNGITMICKKVEHDEIKNGMRYIPLVNPQVVNGCQTVNSIFAVLDVLSEKEIQQQYSNVFVMAKVLVITENSNEDREFYKNVVRYTNRQNSVPDKAFLSTEQTVFARIQIEFAKRGFFLRVKQSDKAKFDLEYSEKQKADMLKKANETISIIGVNLKNAKDICIDLEKLLQVLLAYIEDGHFGYTKKSLVLKQGSGVFEKISINIQDYLSVDNMIKLYYIYKRAEFDQKHSEDKRTPIPYYVIGFISYHLKGNKTSETMNRQLNNLFNLAPADFDKIYNYLTKISTRYRERCQKNNIEYNNMIKQRINYEFVREEIENYKSYVGDKEIKALEI